MVRVEFRDQNNTTIMQIEGRFVGHYAENARSAVIWKNLVGQFLVDLSDLSWTDRTGEDVLRWLASIGCSFLAGNAYSAYVCEKLQLRLAQQASPEAAVNS